MNKIKLQEEFWDEAGCYFGYDIINSKSHPFKEAFELYCKIKKEEEENDIVDKKFGGHL